jgi:rhamnosyltransferase
VNVAILLATYNGAEFLAEQLKSFSTQKCVNIKIFLSDHNSTDKSKDIFTSYCQENFIEYEIINSPVKYIGAGQNFFHLIRNVVPDKFNFYAFADQDDIWLDNKLKHAINQLKKNNNDGYSSSVKSFTITGKYKFINKYPIQKEFDYFFHSPGPGCTFVLTEELYTNLHNFIKLKSDTMKNIYYHDWFIYSYARHFNYKWFIDPVSFMLYRQHEKNDTGANFSLNAKFKRFKLLWNNWAFSQALDIATILGYNKKFYVFYKNYPVNIIVLIFSFFKYRRDLVSSFVILFFVILKRFSPN